MMSFFYDLDYGSQSSSEPLFHAKVFVIADKYEVEGLQKLAVQHCEAAAKQLRFTSSFAETIAFIYDKTTTTHRSIRDAVLHIANENTGKMLKRKPFTEMLDTNGEFARELLQLNYGLELGYGNTEGEASVDTESNDKPASKDNEKAVVCFSCDGQVNPEGYCPGCEQPRCTYCGDDFDDCMQCESCHRHISQMWRW